MRVAAVVTLLLVSVARAAAADPTSLIEPVTVMIDHAKILRLPERTQTVIVGNPIIADVSVQKSGVLVLTGKSYGRTNLIALDAGGLLIAESMISVQAQNEEVVTVQRGLGHASATTTLSTYSHLWPTAEDRTRMMRALAESL